MIDKSISEENLTPENFKNYVLTLECENLKKINKEDKKSMVAKIIRTYEESKKNGNK